MSDWTQTFMLAQQTTTLATMKQKINKTNTYTHKKANKNQHGSQLKCYDFFIQILLQLCMLHCWWEALIPETQCESNSTFWNINGITGIMWIYTVNVISWWQILCKRLFFGSQKLISPNRIINFTESHRWIYLRSADCNALIESDYFILQIFKFYHFNHSHLFFIWKTMELFAIFVFKEH